MGFANLTYQHADRTDGSRCRGRNATRWLMSRAIVGSLAQFECHSTLTTGRSVFLRRVLRRSGVRRHWRDLRLHRCAKLSASRTIWRAGEEARRLLQFPAARGLHSSIAVRRRSRSGARGVQRCSPGRHRRLMPRNLHAGATRVAGGALPPSKLRCELSKPLRFADLRHECAPLLERRIGERLCGAWRHVPRRLNTTSRDRRERYSRPYQSAPLCCTSVSPRQNCAGGRERRPTASKSGRGNGALPRSAVAATAKHFRARAACCAPAPHFPSRVDVW
jgi:hypothetical protein